MIVSVVAGFLVILSILLGEYLTSLVFGSVKGLKEYLLEVLLFLIIFNLFLSNILVKDDLLVQLILYFLVGFVSVVASKSVVFFLFRSVKRFLFKRNEFNEKLLKLAELLNQRLSKEEVTELFKNSGFGTSFLNHLKKTLKD